MYLLYLLHFIIIVELAYRYFANYTIHGQGAWVLCHHKRFQALYEVPKSPIVFNDFLVSLTDLEALSVVLLLCSSILNDEEENDILIYTYIWYMCFILFSSSSSKEDNTELGFVLSQSDIISCLCRKVLKLQQ